MLTAAFIYSMNLLFRDSILGFVIFLVGSTICRFVNFAEIFYFLGALNIIN